MFDFYRSTSTPRALCMTRPHPSARKSDARSWPVPPDVRVSGLWAFESRHDTSFSMQTTRHSFLKLLWIREGTATIEFEAKRMTCEMGDLVIVPPHLPHRIIDSPDAPVSLCGLGVDFKRLRCVEPVLPLLAVGVHRGSELRSLQIEQSLRKILYLIDQDDPASQLSSVATAINLLAEMALILAPPAMHRIEAGNSDQTARSFDPMLDAYLAWLHRNFYEPLSLDDAAAATGMSRRSFTNQFKARTGTSWLKYLNILRVGRAEELLAQTDRKVTSIAFQCGFDDLSTFYRAFKRIKGRSPRAS